MASVSFSDKVLTSIPLSPTRDRIGLVLKVSSSLAKFALNILNNEPQFFEPHESEKFHLGFYIIFRTEMRKNKKFELSDLSQKIRDLLFFNPANEPKRSNHEIAHEIKKFSFQLLTNEFVGLGVSCLQPQFTVTKTDLTLSKLYSYITLEPLTGFEFAAYHFNLFSNQQHPFAVHFDPVTIPQAGDAILYGDESLSARSFKHVGIFLSSNTVVSKWGTYPEVLVHKVDSIKNFYGNCVMYLRKKTKFHTESLLINRATSVENGLYSPYTLKGLRINFINYFIEMAKREHTIAFVNGMCGERAVKRYSKMVLSQLLKPVSLHDSRPEYLSHLKAMAKGISDDQPVTIPLA